MFAGYMFARLWCRAGMNLCSYYPVNSGMIETSSSILTDGQGNKVLSFTVGANDYTVFSSTDRQYIVAKGAVTHIIEDPDLVSRILAKYSPSKN
jgi:hypothetical protein